MDNDKCCQFGKFGESHICAKQPSDESPNNKRLVFAKVYNIGKIRFGIDTSYSSHIGFIKNPFYYIWWSFHIGPFFIQRWAA